MTTPPNPPKTIVVIPCFNEAGRLPRAEIARFLGEVSGIDLLFVNDGSSDGTLGALEQLAQSQPGRIEVLDRSPNQGKAEAVRAGLQEAFRRGAEHAGFWDADLATPLDEVPRFVAALEADPACQMVFGSRVKLLGRRVERSPLRHYAGRVFATLVSLTLEVSVYDTQCGAKLFRNTPEIRALFDEPFLTRWVFDVEILARWIRERGRDGLEQTVREQPVRSWHHVEGSKVVPLDFFRGVRDLVRIRRAVLGGR